MRSAVAARCRDHASGPSGVRQDAELHPADLLLTCRHVLRATATVYRPDRNRGTGRGRGALARRCRLCGWGNRLPGDAGTLGFTGGFMEPDSGLNLLWTFTVTRVTGTAIYTRKANRMSPSRAPKPARHVRSVQLGRGTAVWPIRTANTDFGPALFLAWCDLKCEWLGPDAHRVFPPMRSRTNPCVTARPGRAVTCQADAAMLLRPRWRA